MKKLIIALILMVLPMSAMAMDAITNNALDGVSGQAGVTVGFSGTTTTTITFSQLSWGDPDGCAPAACSNAGWIILKGDITVAQTIADGQLLTLDVGTTSAACVIGGLTIPINESFIKVGLPDTTLAITLPSTLEVGLGSSSGTIDGTLGLLYLKNLSVTAGTPSALYIWAH